jgi:hypothetical protein
MARDFYAEKKSAFLPVSTDAHASVSLSPVREASTQHPSHLPVPHIAI